MSLLDQFTRLRDGDRFWCQNDPDYSKHELSHIKNTTLADIIKRNTGITKIQPNVLFVHGNGRTNFLDVEDVAATVAVVPEPATAVVFGIGMMTLLVMIGLRRRTAGA